jgi:hypothetical protein
MSIQLSLRLRWLYLRMWWNHVRVRYHLWRMGGIPIPEHIEKQRRQGPPYYCGTAFCGHHTIRAAAECWQQHCARDGNAMRREYTERVKRERRG